jgi:monoterpene epsilon-lactone hydrolase
MPVLNRKKMRSDVLKMIDNQFKFQMKGVAEIKKRFPNEKFDFMPLWQRVLKINEQVFKNEIDREEATKLLTMDEMLYLSKVMRFMFDFVADQDQKEHPVPENVKIKSIDADGVSAEWQIVPNALKNKVILYIHGGGFILGSINSHRLLTVAIGIETKLQVLSINYRLAPENNFPAPLNDGVTAYKWLLSSGIKPENIVIMGDSAGGNLTLVTLLKLKKDGIKLPAGAVMLSPIVDFTFSDESFLENAETDPMLADVGAFWWSYAYFKDADPKNPLISPLFGDLKGLPPLLFQASKCESLYSDSVRIVDKAKKAGVDVTLQTWDDMPHVFQGFGLEILPEAKEAIKKIEEFIHKVIPFD